LSRYPAAFLGTSYVRVGTEVYAFKEVVEHLAMHEYRLLRDLTRLDTPSVEAVWVVTERVDHNGEALDPILITRHLQFSLPYRSLSTAAYGRTPSIG
jgi:hypothetical protein